MAIFVSYSRRDDAFVRQLHERILARGRETWVDWEGIPPSADWMREIREAIDAAEAVVFVISPDSLASGVCAQELEHAVAQNKRVIPVVCRDVDAAAAAASIARLNWVFFTTVQFDRAFETLIEAVDTDLEWVQAHTRLLVRSTEWERRGRDPSLTLRGADLKLAERWLTESPNKSPHATEVQTRYILESRRRATQRRYAAWGGVAVALAITAVLGTLFVLQRNETTRQQTSAFARRLAGTADRVRATPAEFSTATDRNIFSAQLAVEALRRVDALGLRSVDADVALRQAVALLPPRIAELGAVDSDPLDVVAFETSGGIVAARRLHSAAYVWNPDFRLNATKQAASADARRVVLSPDGRFLAVIDPEGRRGIVEVRDTRSNAVIATLSDIQTIVDVAVAPEGRYAVVSGNEASSGPERRARATLVTLPGGSSVTLPHMLFPSFSDDGRYLLGKVDEVATVWAVRETAANPRPAFVAPMPATTRPAFSAGSTHLAFGYGKNPERLGVWRTGTWSKGRDVDIPQVPPLALIGIGPEARHVVMGAAGGRTARVRVIDAEAGCDVAVVIANSIESAAISRDGLRLAAMIGGAVHIYALPQGCGLFTHVQTAGRAVRVDFTGEDGSVAIVERVGQGQTAAALLRTVAVDGRQTSSHALPAFGAAALSSDGRWLAVAEGGRLRLLNVQTAAERANADAGSRIEALSVSADPLRVAAVTADSKLHVWEGSALRAIGSVTPPDEIVREFLAVGSRGIAAMTDQNSRAGRSQTVRRWTLPSLDAVSEQPVGVHRGGLAAAACGLSADGDRVLIRAKGIGVIVRDTATGADIAVVDDAGGGGTCALSDDGRYLAVESGADVRIWDAAAGVEVAGVRAAPGGVERIAFSPGARYLALLSDAGAVSITPLRPVDLVQQACARLPSNMNPDDWERYVGREPVRATCPNLPAGER